MAGSRFPFLRPTALLLSLAVGFAPTAALAQKRPPAAAANDAVVLKHTPPDGAERNKELVLRATIAAPAGAYLPTLYYRPQGENRFYSLPMLPVPGAVDIYAGAIPGIFVTKDIEYYLESYDTQLRGPGQYGNQKSPVKVKVMDPEAAPSQVAVRSDPAEATLVIDGDEVGLTPWRGPMPPGQHELVLKKEGFLEAASAFEVPPGRDLDLRLSLTNAQETAQFAIMSEPSGASVTIDGQLLGTTPLIAPSPEGEHRLSLEKQGFARAERTVTFSKERSIEVSITLQKLPPEPALAVTTDPTGADVLVDEKPLGKTPFIGVIPAGEHTLLLKKDGRRTAQAQILMPEDRDLDLRFSLEEAKEAKVPVIAVSSDPVGASVLVDGAEVGKTPYINTLAAGAHKIRLSQKGFVAYERKVVMPDDHDVEVTLALIPEPPPPGPSKVTFNSVPNGLLIAIDGDEKGITPMTVELPAGQHVASAQKDGFRSVEERFTVVQGEGLQLKLALQPMPKEAAAEPLLSVRTEPDGAVVNIDGQQVGATPFSATLKPGKHKLLVSAEGFKLREETFELPEDRAFELRYAFTLQPLRKSVSLASATEQKKEEANKAKEPVVDLENVKSAGNPLSGAKYKVYKPGELAKIASQREAERKAKAGAQQGAHPLAAQARPTLPKAAMAPVQCPPPMVSQSRAGPFVLGILGAAAAGAGGFFAWQASNTLEDLSKPGDFDRSSLRAQQRQEGLISVAALGGGVVLGLIGALWGSSASPMVPARMVTKSVDPAPEVKPAEVKPAENKTIEAKKADEKPAEAKPAEPAVEAKKDAPKPADAKPAEAKPADAKDEAKAVKPPEPKKADEK